MIWALIGLLAIILSCLQDLAIVAGVLILAVIGLAIVVYLANGIKWLWGESTKTLKLAGDGLKTKRNIRKLSVALRKETKTVDSQIARLEYLRNQKIDNKTVNRLCSFVKLMSTCSTSLYADQCYAIVGEKKNILTEIADIEAKILDLADKYQNIGNAEKCAYYLGFLPTGKGNGQLARVEMKCRSQATQREAEKQAIQKVVTAAIIVLSIILLIIICSYSANTPYREMEAAMRNETLTREQCSYSSKGNAGSVYEYINTDKGKKIIAKLLTEYHKNDDIESALWLICVQPGYIDGYDIAATEAFIDWISESARRNGRLVEDGIETYKLHGYSVAIYDYSETYLRISDGNQWAEVEQKVSYQDDVIPVIY